MNTTDTPRASARADQVPALSLVQSRALDLLVARTLETGRLAQLVEVDAALVGAVMRVVRCPLYGLSRTPTLPEALEMIGAGVLERLFRAIPPVQGPDLAAAIAHACRHWVQGVAVAAAARWLSNQGGYEAPDEAHLAGLVHDAGRLLGDPEDDPRASARRTEALVRGWGLGVRIGAVARFHRRVLEGVPADAIVVDGAPLDERTQRLVAVVARGVAVASALGFAAEPGDGAGAAGDADAAGAQEAVVLELAHAGDLLGLPPVPPSAFVREVTRAEQRARADAASPPRASHARTAVRVAAVHQEVADTRGLTSINDILDRGLRAIHEKLEFDRLLLCDREPGRSDLLRTKLVLDPTAIEFPRGVGGVEIPADPQGAIARALDTAAVCRGDDPRADRAVLEHMGVASFAAVPLRAGTASMGAVVADHFFSRRPVTEADAALLGIVCSALGLALENVALGTQSEKLRALAEKDELTGIANRRNILAVLQREIDRARRYGKPLAVAMIDVDHFKSWNDLFGHQVGDLVLQAVAQLISSCSREIDAYGRYGGEEFLVVLPETPVDHGVLYAERLRVTIENHAAELQARWPGSTLSVSVGVTALSLRGDDVERVIRRADAALYAAKKHGRNRVCVEMPGDHPQRPPSPLRQSHGVLDEL